MAVTPKPAKRRRWSTAEQFAYLPPMILAPISAVGNVGVGQPWGSWFAGCIALSFLWMLYFLPSVVGEKKRNARAILVLNIFLGWTVIGWIVALIWAVTVEKPEP